MTLICAAHKKSSGPKCRDAAVVVIFFRIDRRGFAEARCTSHLPDSEAKVARCAAPGASRLTTTPAKA